MSATCFASAAYICPRRVDSVVVVEEVTEIVGTITEQDNIAGVVSDASLALAGTVVDAEMEIKGTIADEEQAAGTITPTTDIGGTIDCE